jgi:hypothetical protein
MIERNTGADLLPFAPRPSYPGARLRAMRDARARREREAPRPWDADRLRADLRALQHPVNWTEGHDGDLAAELRRRGWDDDRLAAAQTDLRDDLSRRVHPPMRPAVTAGAAVSSSSAGGGTSTTFAPAVAPAVAAAVASGRTLADRRGAAANIMTALRMGLDPATLWPGQLGFPGRPTASLSAGGLRNRPATADQGWREPRSPRFAGRSSSGAYRDARRATSGRPREYWESL